MATLVLVIGLAALLPMGSAQNTTINVWSAVSFVLYGERTPIKSNNPSLTPIGAQQMFEQGSVFRARYMGPNSTSTDDDATITTQAPIQGLEHNAIDNSQLSIMATTDEYSATSAMAFLQGLYPPTNQSFAPNAGGLESGVLADGSLVNFPLGGYQYPVIQAVSVLDPDIVWIAGNAPCTEWLASVEDTTSAVEDKVYNQTLAFFEQLWQQVYANAFPYSLANWNNAYDIYDYVSYHYEHNAAVQDKVGAANLALLREYASTQQRDLSGNLTVSGLVQGDMIRAVSGRTLAAWVVAQMKQNIAWAGSAYKLNLMFGSFEPFIAFFALASLVNGPSGADFQPLPYPGAVMTFELYSVGGNDSVLPETDQLMVRFLYRNSTDPGVPFLEYPLFGNSPSKSSMTYDNFVSSMDSISMDSVADWCVACNSDDLFCAALTDNAWVPTNSSSTAHSGLSPAVAGVIGAIAALVFIALAAVLAALLGGLRISRRDAQGRNSTLGGFKGAEKMSSDTDLAYSKGGARHERTDSWELRNGGTAAAGADSAEAAAAAVEQPRDRVRSTIINKGDDDAISVIGHMPVSPVESV